jgi:DNA modification methylase
MQEVAMTGQNHAGAIPESSHALSVEYKMLEELKPYSSNARTHKKHQIRQIAESVRAFGFTNPILIDSQNRIVAGHGRVEAAKLLSMTRVPTICLEDLAENQIRAYVIADNRLAELAGWDKSILSIELQNLLNLDGDDFDVTVTGFEVAEIDQIVEEASSSTEMDDVVPEPILDHAPVTDPGDIWLLGKHRVLCGNSLYMETFKSLMGSRRAAVVFIDPPYNVRIDGHATGNGTIHHREFAMASGELSEVEFISFLSNSLHLLTMHSVNSAVHYVCIDWRHVGDLISTGKRIYDELLNVCVWVKNVGGMGSFYRSQHELICVFRKGKGPHRNNVQLGQFGRNRTNVWQYPGIQTQSKQGDEGNLLALHPTVKPVAMIADAILDCTSRGDIVLDSFLGSGSTLMAAERVGRICYGIEIDPLYVDVAIRRWQKQTGDFATHSVTGMRFDDIASKTEVHHA